MSARPDPGEACWLSRWIAGGLLLACVTWRPGAVEAYNLLNASLIRLGLQNRPERAAELAAELSRLKDFASGER